MSREAVSRWTDLPTRPLAWLLLCLLVGACASVIFGQDANWDLRNYHLYNAFAALNGRTQFDLMPAGLQSNFNPLLDLPYYMLARGPLAATPRLMAAAGLPFGLLLFATLCLARWVLQPRDLTGHALTWIAVAIGGTAAATASEIGTTFNDIPCAALLVGALAMGGPGCPERPAPWRLACAGAMVGIAVALKLTCAVTAPAVVAALLVATPGWRTRCKVLLIVGAAAAVAAAALAGPWAWLLMQRYGSPTFPLANALFRSPWYPPHDSYDLRFLPRDALQAWFYPFWWLRTNAGLVTELPFRDARAALAMLALPVLAVGLLRADAARRRRVSALMVAALIGYLGWLRMFSILRYAVALEALAAVMTVVALQDIARLTRLRATAPVLGTMLFALLLWHTKLPAWERIPYGRHVFEVETIRLPPDSLVLAVGAPVASVIPFLDAPGMRAVGLLGPTLEARGWRLHAEAVRIIRSHEGPVFAIAPGAASLAMVPPEAGLAFDAAQCRPIRANFSLDTVVDLCPARRTGPASAESSPATAR